MTGIRRSEWMRRRRLQMFRLRKSERILDLGCGDGLDIRVLRKAGYKHMTGVDISPALIRQAQKMNPGVRFVRASAEQLPFASEAFDVVLADSMLYHLVGNSRAMREVRRVLVTHGRLCFIDMHGSWIRDLFNSLTLSPVAFMIPYVQRRQHAYQTERSAIERWHRSEKNFLRMLTRAGFENVYTRIDGLSIIGVYRRV